ARFENYEHLVPGARQILISTTGTWAPGDQRKTYLEILPTQDVHDSRLSVAEIAAIPLAAELVTLAACDTARGKTRLSDERLDLTRAFLTAGAASVLATRWKVPDEPATTRFLLDFYRAYRQGGPDGQGLRKDQALNRARRRARERGDPAQVWAAWVLVGDAR
ncbi:MAG TPA: CHAT domain-containing protein, partial [Thermoanaerobaculia bacterium]|nr:CHAT domain-containing protein [Thermoanaerobaculia bacterium]